jgi:hypothetical protein
VGTGGIWWQAQGRTARAVPERARKNDKVKSGLGFRVCFSVL